MLLGNDERIWVRPRPEIRATEFTCRVEHRGQTYGVQSCIAWRDFDDGYWEHDYERFFAKIERGIAEILNQVQAKPHDEDDLLCEKCGEWIPPVEFWEHDCD